MSPDPAVDPALRATLDGVIADAEAGGGRMALVAEHLEQGWRYGRREDEVFVAASVIKLPILVALHAAAAEGRLGLHERLRLRPEDQVTGSGVLQWLSPGLSLPLRDLAELMIACSDNAATNMLLRRLGPEAVNACLAGLGLQRSRVRRPLQVVPADGGEPNTVTAGEMVALLVRIARGQAVSFEACRRMVATLKRTQASDALPALLPPHPPGPVGAPPRWEWAHKTGSVTGCEHDVGLLFLPGHTLAVAALTSGCGTARQARAAIAAAGRALYEACAEGLSGPPG